MKRYKVRHLKHTPSTMRIDYPNIHQVSPDLHSIPQSNQPKAKFKSNRAEKPNRVLYYFNNAQSLQKIKLLKNRFNDQSKQLTDKQVNDNTLIEEVIDTDKIMNPFLIKNFSNGKSNMMISFSSLKKSKSASCNLNSTGYRTLSRIPSMFNGYVTKYTRFSPSELFERDRYSKEKINLKEIRRNQQANQMNYTKAKLRLFQMKQSIHFYKNEKDLINRYKTCAVYNKII